jgi:hypothetical protein
MVLMGLCLLLGLWAQRTYQAQPTDDVWFYDNAFNPGFTAILRVWGDGQNAVDPTGAYPAQNFSYSLAKWNLQGILAGRRYQVLAAQIVVVQTQPPGYTRAEAEQSPLEARNLSHTDFTEASWDYDAPNNPYPGETVLGTSRMTNYRTDAPFAIPIPLDREVFEPYFNAAVTHESWRSRRSAVLSLLFTQRCGRARTGAAGRLPSRRRWERRRLHKRPRPATSAF